MRFRQGSMFLLQWLMVTSLHGQGKVDTWIRINQLGYTPEAIKVAVLASKKTAPGTVNEFQLVDVKTSSLVLRKEIGKNFGAYGPFVSSFRLDFTEFKTSGTYYLQMGEVRSAIFRISPDVYRGTADFTLRYMRQQRSGYNPFLKDSCHTKDGFTIYGPMPDKTFIDVSGGWHDATDYLQYAATSANATYSLLAAYRDFPEVFTDHYLSNGLDGNNGTPDVLDEATWGLQWLVKMHPREGWMFDQIADDRDHVGFRLPNRDSADYGYGKGKGRPVYFASGQIQGLGKYKNRTTGTASIAGKFASAFALGSQVLNKSDPAFALILRNKSISAYRFGLAKPGVAQTAPNKARYFYEEDNWVDDMELGAAAIYQLTHEPSYFDQGLHYSTEEKVTPWMGADTARHYQWYPFHNFGHYELAEKSNPEAKARLVGYYKEGIERIWQRAKGNAFYRGIPFIWCSNNLTTSFAIQCYLYRKLSGDKTYSQLEQACFDWLFGCNPWGTSMVFGLPAQGDTPVDPHSSFTALYQYPLDGGLVDGPVYGDIYKSLLGIELHEADEYAEFQSKLAVYHDDSGDYSTNEPTMDGTAPLIYLLAERENESGEGATKKNETDSEGAIVRGNVFRKEIALVFTGDQYADGGEIIRKILEENKVKAGFFLTGNFYSNSEFKPMIAGFKLDGHYLGAHSDKHLLYADWTKRDSLLVTEAEFKLDLQNNYQKMRPFGIEKQDAPYFLPPYEWYNSAIAQWTKESGLQLINYTQGTLSTADYTFPEMSEKYRSSNEIYKSIMNYESESPHGLNGFVLLIHIGADPRRTDKFYNKLDRLLNELKTKGYVFVRVDKLLE